MYNKKRNLHFVGIGGIGMSGIATILRCQGYTITGCDIDLDKKSIKDLQNIGCTIYAGNNTPACHDPSISVLVYSSAIKADDPEILAAQQHGIPTIPRALMLAELMRTKFSIAIAGAHGKTTTTSLISHILLEAKKDPTVIIGGHLHTLSANAHFGLGDFLVAEADESDKSLSYLQATLAVITNIDLEHLDVYKDIDDIKQTFMQFLKNLPFYGTAIMCTDNEEVRSLLPLSHIKTIKYGLNKAHADIYATNITLYPEHSIFDVYIKDTLLGPVTLNIPGLHNIQNALAAFALAYELDIPLELIQAALTSFKGVDRRFTYRGIYKQAEIFDDYGHHPEEIRNSLLIAKKRTKNKLIAIFQPHRYSRTDKLWNQFIDMFLHSPLDTLIITDIYPASEEPIPEITAQNLVKALEKYRPPFQVIYAPYEDDFSTLQALINEKAAPDDLILIQGAGKIYKLAQKLNN